MVAPGGGAGGHERAREAPTPAGTSRDVSTVHFVARTHMRMHPGGEREARVVCACAHATRPLSPPPFFWPLRGCICTTQPVLRRPVSLSPSLRLPFSCFLLLSHSRCRSRRLVELRPGLSTAFSPSITPYVSTTSTLCHCVSSPLRVSLALAFWPFALGARRPNPAHTGVSNNPVTHSTLTLHPLHSTLCGIVDAHTSARRVGAQAPPPTSMASPSK